VTQWQDLLQRASALRQAGRVAEAIQAYQRLLDVRPDLPESWYNLGWLQRQARQFEAALTSYRQALDRGISEPHEVHLNRAVILSDHLHRPDDAQAELQAALALAPRYGAALLNLGNLHEDRGDRSAAAAAYRRALEVDPGNMLALARLAGVTEPVDADDPIISRLRLALADPHLDGVERADLGFALGRLLDLVGDYDGAFAAFADANAASGASCGSAFRPYDPAAHSGFVDRTIAAFPAPSGSAGNGLPERVPVFICGMFRSGSTLVEQILAGHPAIAAGGELETLPVLVRTRLQPYPEAAATANEHAIAELRQLYLRELAGIEPDKPRVTDKRPDNFLHIGLIKRLFPTAKIIHTRRNPLDNVLSLYFLQLNPEMAYALDLEHAAHWYLEHDRLMAHWQALYPADIFDIDYDALVVDPEPVIRSALAFLGLGWSDACLDFSRRSGIVKTASVWQVRQPLHRKSSGRWRHYAHHLERVRELLGAGQSA